MEIKFYPENKLVKEVIPPPSVVKVPSWFKNIPNYQGGAESLIVENGEPNYSVKSCLPFIDTFFTGYTFELWCDVQVRQINGNPIFTWGNTNSQMSPIVDRTTAHLPIHDGFLPFTFSWSSHWGIETPKGYSCLFTHPLNRTDLPFITTSGIMDTDKWGIWGNQPFAFKKDWEGILEAGTPIIQFIPFKRESWQSKVLNDFEKSEWAFFEYQRKNSRFRGYYKNKYWNRKEYK